MLSLFRDGYRYREVVSVLGMKELKVRYKRSFLGFVWALLHPLFMMVILTIVFSSVMKIPVDQYAVFMSDRQEPGTQIPVADLLRVSVPLVSQRSERHRRAGRVAWPRGLHEHRSNVG